MTMTGKQTVRSLGRLALIALLGLSGCSLKTMFDGESRPWDQVAVVRAYGVVIHRVNNKEFPSDGAGAVILPGTNKFIVSPQASNFQMLGGSDVQLSIVMVASAGVDYVITAQRGDGRLCAFPVAKETGLLDTAHPAGCASR